MAHAGAGVAPLAVSISRNTMSISIRSYARSLLISGIFTSIVVMSGCGRSTEDPAAGLPGRAEYSGLNCPLCHGEYAEGTERAPRLRELGRNFSREQLVEYLSDPDAYIARDSRLTAQQSSYSAGMPAFKHLGPERLGLLADYLLALR